MVRSLSEDILKGILEEHKEKITIEGVGEVTVRLPTIRDRLEVKKDLKRLPNYNDLDDNEKLFYEAYLIALRCLVDPKITLEQFLNSPDVKILQILEGVSNWYNNFIRKLNEKRSEYLKNFLGVERENIQ